MKIGNLHISAIVCFVIAGILYSVGSQIAIGLGAVGVLFEIAAWIIAFSSSNDTDS